MHEHGKGVAGLMTATVGAIVSWWPLVDVVIRDVSGIAAAISGIYAALYFRRQWKKS